MPFTDHRGSRAISAYYGKSPQPGSPILPPQMSFHYYITSGTTAETASTLPEELVEATKYPVDEVYPFRLDVYFLPETDLEGCMEHYRSEMAARLSKPPPRNFIGPYCSEYSEFNLLVQIDSVDWKVTGATLALFDATSRLDDEGEPPRSHIHRNVPWGDETTSYHDPQYLGMRLHDISRTTGCHEMDSVYQERLSEGHSDWA